jgi:hypothetical protein
MPAAMRSPAAGFSTPPSHRAPQTGYGTPGSGLRSPAVGGGAGAAASRLPALLKWIVLLSLILGMAMALTWMQPAGDASLKVRMLRLTGSSSAAGCGRLTAMRTWPHIWRHRQSLRRHFRIVFRKLMRSCARHVGAGGRSAEAVWEDLPQSYHGAG